MSPKKNLEENPKKKKKETVSRTKTVGNPKKGERAESLRGSGSNTGARETENEVSDFYSLNFPTPERLKEYFDNFAYMPVYPGRAINFTDLRMNDFPFIDQLNYQGWLRFMSMDRDYYTDLVKAFYANGNYKFQRGNKVEEYDDMFETFVNGTRIVVNVDLFERLWNMPKDGKCFKYSDYGDPERKDNEALHYRITKKEDSVGRLKFHDRLLHLLITWVLRPVGGAYSKVSKEDLYFMGCIKKQKKVNLASFIIHDVIRIIKGEIKKLHYGMAISTIIDFFNVDVSQTKKVKLDPKRTLGIKSINKTHYKKVGNEWHKVGESDDEEEQEQAQNQPPQAQAPNQDNQVVLQYLQGMEERLVERFNSSLDGIRTELTGLGTRVQQLEGAFHKFYPTSPISSPPPPTSQPPPSSPPS